jgi:acyl-CoA reductase-like NAD-dependent aldehyde dehydrogenase
MYEFGNLVGGRRIPGAGAEFVTVNPARPGMVVGRYSTAAVLGDGMQAGTTMGPLTNERQLARVAAIVEAWAKEAATLLAGGHAVRVAGCVGGYFYAPTLVADVGPEMGVAREEIFGRVITTARWCSDSSTSARMACSTSTTARPPTATCPPAE